MAKPEMLSVRLSGMKKPIKVYSKLHALMVFRRVTGLYYTVLGMLFDRENYLEQRGAVGQDRCGAECDLLIGKPVKWSLEAALMVACCIHRIEPSSQPWDVAWDLIRHAGKPGKDTISYDEAIHFLHEILSVYGLHDERTLFAAENKKIQEQEAA